MSKIEVINPYSGVAFESINLMSLKEVQEVVSTAHQLHKSCHLGLEKHVRISVLERFLELLKASKSELIQLSVQEGGKPLIDTEVEFNRALLGVQLGIQSIYQIKGEEVPMGLTSSSEGRLAFTQKLPIGVVLSISAFNHPINLAIHQIVPAIAAGCPVIYKPALTTPLVSRKMVELLHEAGLPSGWCNYILCDNETISEICKDSKLGYISFIGSSKVGWQIKANVAPGVHVALEHGGNAPIVVCSDADLAACVPSIAKAGFYHAGQVCVSAQRIIVHESILDSFVALLNREAQSLKVGNPLLEDTMVGPMITPQSVDRMSQLVEDSIKYGATLICGGNKIGTTCFEPTILLNPSVKSEVTTSEIFGPIVCVYTFKSNEEAVSKANDSHFHFQSAVYTKDLSNAMFFTEQLNAATVLVNDHTAFRTDWMPFGGQGESGIGIGGINNSVQEMLKQKLIIIRK